MNDDGSGAPAVSPAQVPELSVVIPVLDGEPVIARTLAEVGAWLAGRGLSAEVVVVDDGSRDRTVEKVREAAARSPVPVVLERHETNRGKGAAVRTGMLAARGRHRVFLDSDLAYPAPEIGRVLDALRSGADVAIASRVDPESLYVVRPAFFRYLYTRHVAGRFFNWLVRLLLLPGVSDTQAGLKGFTAEAATALFSAWVPGGFGFDLAVLARARRLGFSLAEVPVTFRYDREPTTLRFLADTVRMLRDLAEVRVRVGSGGVVGDPGRDRAGTPEPAPAPAPSWTLLAGLAALLAAVEWSRSARMPFWVPLGGFLVAVVVLLVAAARSDRTRGVRRVRWSGSRGETVFLLGLVVLAAVPRLAALSDLPSFMHHDTAACGLVGQQLLTGEATDPFELVDRWYHFPRLGLLPYTVSLRLLGTSVLALRLTSAIPGALVVLALYFLVRGWFGRLAAAIAAILLATSHVAVHFSRVGIWNIHALLLGVAGLAALASGWRRRSLFWLTVAGLCFGLTLHAYTAGRLFFGLGLLSVAGLALAGRRRAARPLAWLVLAIVLPLVPLAASFVRKPGGLAVDRERSVNPFATATRQHLISQIGTADKAAILKYQVTRTLGGFVTLGDTSTNYGSRRPLIGPVTLVLFLGGLGFAVVRLPDRRFALLVAWLGAGLLFGGVLTVNPPNFPRLLAVVPVPFVLAGVALGLIWEKARTLGPVLRTAAALLAVGVAVSALVSNARGYLRFMERVEISVNEWDVLESLDDLRDVKTVYLFTGAYMLADSPLFRLFKGGRRLVTGVNGADLPDDLEEPTAFVVTPDNREVGTVLTERFPDLDREVRMSEGVRQLTIYRTMPAPRKGGT